jgi:hypothetical protein
MRSKLLYVIILILLSIGVCSAYDEGAKPTEDYVPSTYGSSATTTTSTTIRQVSNKYTWNSVTLRANYETSNNNKYYEPISGNGFFSFNSRKIETNRGKNLRFELYRVNAEQYQFRLNYYYFTDLGTSLTKNIIIPKYFATEKWTSQYEPHSMSKDHYYLLSVDGGQRNILIKIIDWHVSLNKHYFSGVDSLTAEVTFLYYSLTFASAAQLNYYLFGTEIPPEIIGFENLTLERAKSYLLTATSKYENLLINIGNYLEKPLGKELVSEGENLNKKVIAQITEYKSFISTCEKIIENNKKKIMDISVDLEQTEIQNVKDKIINAIQKIDEDNNEYLELIRSVSNNLDGLEKKKLVVEEFVKVSRKL